MTMKSIFFVVAVAALVGAAIASCPNACSGHGSCGNHDRCSCYANFVGGDCSEKACPYGRSGQECSGRGSCDRGAGSCECADGYSGASCQRTSCPNGCSGKGSCDTTTGMCSCAGGYSGNDCATRLCPKGDDPLTHEVENSGDGTVSQQSEVQTVTFNAGRGLGGTATLTYNDLYGQSWTTRPFNVGGDNVYRLEVSISSAVTVGSDKQKIKFSYNGVTSAVLETHTETSSPTYSVSTKSLTAGSIRNALLPLFAGFATKPIVKKDRGNTLYVREHHSATSVKLGGAIYANTRLTFDIHIPVDMSGHDDNGALASAFTVAWEATPAANTQELKLYQLGDRSAEIESALTSLPNQVIPSVTVSKVGVTDTDTNSDGANGNIHAQSYAITFSNEANSGDQNMLTCNAAPCDEDGCINRGPGVSEVRYMHHDHAKAGEGINFVNQGYFIMDVGEDAANGGLSAGSIKIMWDTGAGIDSAIFAIVATAAEVQTALRTITGWEGVTVELWGSRRDSSASAALRVLSNHQFKVTFPAGYDDLGKSPTFYTMQNTDGAYAAPSPANARARLYDQRFSNSIWLGKVTGYTECASGGDAITCDLQFSPIDIATTVTPTDVLANAENGDTWVTSAVYFGAGGTHGNDAAASDAGSGTLGATSGAGGSITLLKQTTAMTKDIAITGGDIKLSGTTVNYAYLKEGKTSVQTSDYFAVGSTVEAMGTSWTAAAPQTDITSSDSTAKNLYRKFKITGHVTNEFNREFAKLDSFPQDDGVTYATSTANTPKYLLKITSNNGTVHTYPTVNAKVTVKEVQVITLGKGQKDSNVGTGTAGNVLKVWKLYYKGEESQNMDGASTAAQIAEEINGFSQLSGPVTVVGEVAGTVATGFARFEVTFDAKDGDVAQMTAIATAGVNAADTDNTFDSDAVTVSTRANGWSIEAPVGEGLDTMQAGGIINITAAEVCTFVEGTALSVGHFCYDNVCGPEITTLALIDTGTDAADGLLFRAAVRGIKDDNGDAILGTATVVVVEASRSATVTMPLGKSCDSLELRGTTNAITKTVAKNNNGKLFRITRSFLKTTDLVNLASKTLMHCAPGDCHDALEVVDSIILGGSSCAAAAATDGPAYPVVRAAGAVTLSGDATSTTIAMADVADLTDNTACTMKLGRHVITLDSMPDKKDCDGTTCDAVSIAYTSTVGSCSVAETTKGTYESYECSNRGACDGKSGLCTCYEGYSGQSCQTQTVLV